MTVYWKLMFSHLKKPACLVKFMFQTNKMTKVCSGVRWCHLPKRHPLFSHQKTWSRKWPAMNITLFIPREQKNNSPSANCPPKARNDKKTEPTEAQQKFSEILGQSVSNKSKNQNYTNVNLQSIWWIITNYH